MLEADVAEIMHKFFHSNYAGAQGRQFCATCERLDLRRQADFLYVQSKRNVIHAVQVRENLEGRFDPIPLAQAHPANYWWIALPADEYSGAASAIRAASSAGIGVMLVRGPGRTVSLDEGRMLIREGPPPSVEVKLKAVYDQGDFMEAWPALTGRWPFGDAKRGAPPHRKPRTKAAATGE